MSIPVAISYKEQNEQKTAETKALLDTGAGGKFIDQNYVREQGLETENLEFPIKVYNVDGTPNKRGTIRKYVKLDLTINGQTRSEKLLVMGLGKQRIILGFPWFEAENPDIDWTKGTLTWRNSTPDTRNTPKPFIEEEDDEEEWKTRTINPIDHDDNNILISYLEEIKEEELWINAKTNVAMELAIKENEKKPDTSAKELVPEDLHDFLDVFDEEQAGRLPKSQPWDHKIEMKEGFEPKSFKNYNLTPAEQMELDKFLKENLDKGYIRPSQSPMASP